MGFGVVSHGGSRLLADLAGQITLTAQLSAVFVGRTAPQTAHDPGRVLTDMAVMIADGGEAISDIATLADQPACSVRSLRTRPAGECWTRSARWRWTRSRRHVLPLAKVAWAQRAEQTGQALPASLVAGMPLLASNERPVLVIDDDATIVVTHSE